MGPLIAAHEKFARVLHCFFNDPRDHEVLTKSSWKGKLPCLGGLGIAKMSPLRRAFLQESVLDLKSRLKSRGSDLFIQTGKPENEIPQLSSKIGATAVFCHAAESTEEAEVQKRLNGRLE